MNKEVTKTSFNYPRAVCSDERLSPQKMELIKIGIFFFNYYFIIISDLFLFFNENLTLKGCLFNLHDASDLTQIFLFMSTLNLKFMKRNSLKKHPMDEQFHFIIGIRTILILKFDEPLIFKKKIRLNPKQLIYFLARS